MPPPYADTEQMYIAGEIECCVCGSCLGEGSACLCARHNAEFLLEWNDNCNGDRNTYKGTKGAPGLLLWVNSRNNIKCPGCGTRFTLILDLDYVCEGCRATFVRLFY